jgi:hypothetical protein
MELGAENERLEERRVQVADAYAGCGTAENTACLAWMLVMTMTRKWQKDGAVGRLGLSGPVAAFNARSDADLTVWRLVWVHSH